MRQQLDHAIEIQQQDYRSAEAIYREIISRGAGIDDSIRLEALLNLSDVYRERSISDSALHFAIQASELGKLKQRQDWAATAWLRMGRIYRDLELQEQSEEYIELAQNNTSAEKHPLIWAKILRDRSIVEWNKENFDRSHQFMNLAIKMAMSVGDSSLRQSFMMDKALHYFQKNEVDKGIALYDSLIDQAKNGYMKVAIYHNLITVYLENKLLNKANETSLEFLDYAKKRNTLSVLVQATFDRVTVLEAQGAYQEALDLYFELDEMEDSLYTSELSASLSDMQARFEVSQKQIELDLANTELDAANFRQNAMTIGIVLLVLLILVAAYLFRQRLQNRMLAAESERKEKELFKLKNIELKSAFNEIEAQNEEITASIKYAKRIQNAILPPDRIVKAYLPNSFILYKPKDIVAGDFYWLEPSGDMVFFAAADCTGHGVPGAMVSVICNNGLNRSVREFGLTSPAKILEKTRELVIKEFEKSDEEVKDGMDISLCALNLVTHELHWAGANNPLWIFKPSENGEPELFELKGDKQPIGAFGSQMPFTNYKVRLEKNDILYIFSDGFADQFGGERGKKFKSGNFKRTLAKLAMLPIESQKDVLDQEFEQWRGDLEQLDDVCVFGVKI